MVVVCGSLGVGEINRIEALVSIKWNRKGEFLSKKIEVTFIGRINA